MSLLTVQQVAERLNASETMVYSLMERGELKGVRLSNRWRIDSDSLDHLLSPDSPITISNGRYEGSLADLRKAEKRIHPHAHVPGLTPQEVQEIVGNCQPGGKYSNWSMRELAEHYGVSLTTMYRATRPYREPTRYEQQVAAFAAEHVEAAEPNMEPMERLMRVRRSVFIMCGRSSENAHMWSQAVIDLLGGKTVDPMLLSYLEYWANTPLSFTQYRDANQT